MSNQNNASRPLGRALSDADHLRKDLFSGDALREKHAALRLQATPWYEAMTVEQILAERDAVSLTRYRETIAREYGYENWGSLKQALENAVDRGFVVKVYQVGTEVELARYNVEASNARVAQGIAIRKAALEFDEENLDAEIVWRGPRKQNFSVSGWRSWHKLLGKGNLDTSLADRACQCDAGSGVTACNLCRIRNGEPNYLNPTPADVKRYLQNSCVLFVDDIDRDRDMAADWPFDSLGKAYGCKIVRFRDLDLSDEDSLMYSIEMAEPVERVYGNSEETAKSEARARAGDLGLTVVDLADLPLKSEE